MTGSKSIALRDVLLALDKNADGDISFSEFRLLLERLGWEGDGAQLWASLLGYCRGASAVQPGGQAPEYWRATGDASGRDDSEHLAPDDAAAAAAPTPAADGADPQHRRWEALEAAIAANPSAHALTSADILALYTTPGYDEAESTSSQEALVRDVLRGAFAAAQDDGTAGAHSFDSFCAAVLNIDLRAPSATVVKPRVSASALNPEETSAAAFVAELQRFAQTHLACAHPYLDALATGVLPHPTLALHDFAEEYSRYNAVFAGMMRHAVGVLRSPAHRAALEADLQDEAGEVDAEKLAELAAAGIEADWYEGVPHPALFERFRQAMHAATPPASRPHLLALAAVDKLRRRRSPGAKFASRMSAIVGAEGEAGATAVLGMAVEGIVCGIYSQIVRALKSSTRLAPVDYVFFPLHVVADDGHAATLVGIVEELATTAAQRADMAAAVTRALDARALLWDDLLRRARHMKPAPLSLEDIVLAKGGRMTTATLYDGAAENWKRTEPSCLSDFTAREPIFEACASLLDGGAARVLDLGCGEGYCARRLRQLGAAQVAGIDVSPAMVAAARAAEAADPLGGLHYFEGDVATATDTLRAHLPSLGVALTGELERGAFDLVLAVFVFNYVTLSEMGAAMEQAYRLLKPGGKFVFSVPHPSFPFWGRDRGPPFHFEDHGARYFSARDRLAEGRICTRDGRSLPVRCMHKTFGDYFAALGAAGFACMPEVRELSVTAELSAKDPAFFSSLEEIPLHVLFTVSKPAAPPPAAAAAAAREIIWSSVLDARDLNLDVPPAAMAELAATARALAARGVTAESYVDGDAGALPHLTAMGRAVARRLFVHHGVATLRLDMEALGCGADGSTDELSEATAKLAYYLLCHHVGAVREDRGRLFDVRCRGLDVRADNVLFSASAQECSYHTDSTNRDVFPDLVVLLCVRPAPSGGGESLLTNACNAFYALRNRLPDFLMYELARPTVRDFIGGGLGAELDTFAALGRSAEVFPLRLRYNRFPIFDRPDGGGRLTLRYMRTWVESGHMRAGLRVSPLLRLAMDLLDKELDAQCRVQRRLEPGEILFCNNHVTAHARTAFEDGGAAEGRQGRLLVRTWITYDQSRLAEAGQRK